MSNSFKRTDRIEGMLQRTLAELIRHELKDPRVPMFVTISAVKVSADLSHAKIYFTVLHEDVKKITQLLNTLAPRLRMLLARNLTLRIVPQLQFIYDESIEYAKKLSKLIEQANTSQSSDESD